jgi:hypothetical protein
MNEKQNPSSASSGPNAGSHSSDEASAKSSSKAREGGRDLAQNVKHVADGVVDQARKTAEMQVSDNKARAVDRLSSVAKAIRKTGENLRADDQDALTGYLDRAATQVDMAAGYIRNRTVGQILGDVEGFARRDPALFLGGAFVAGLVGGRFLKSSTATPSGASSIHAHVHPHARNGSTSDALRSPDAASHPSLAPHPAEEGTSKRHSDPGASATTPDMSRDAQLSASTHIPVATKPTQPQAGNGGGSTSKSGPAHRDTTAPKSPGGS